ncbi:MAG: hypothetical protein IKG88_08405 [Bacteroidales bacterium]|nr:hypothetical protein [Bacteroidales bacterium]
MQNNYHTKFILSPVLNILKETVTACTGIGDGIETQSLSEYVLQTTFLKMTGASEQKLKCICWEIATYDYDYRYRYLKKNYGECSRYEDKNSIYSDLRAIILKTDDSFSVSSIFDDLDITGKINEHIDNNITKAIKNQEKKTKKKLSEENKEKMMKGMRDYYTRKGLCENEKSILKRQVLQEKIHCKIIDILNNSSLVIWEQHDYEFYKVEWKKMLSMNYATNELFDNNLQEYYRTIVYNHRNRCAHNLTSYQNNLPTLRTIVEKSFDYENYFFRFALLVLLDEVFMRLYNAYLISTENV